jgi:hypothetical protein
MIWGNRRLDYDVTQPNFHNTLTHPTSDYSPDSQMLRQLQDVAHKEYRTENVAERCRHFSTDFY